MLEFTTTLTRLDRTFKVALRVIADALVIATAFFLAMVLRLENLDFLATPQPWLLIGLSLIAMLPAFFYWGLYRSLVRYVTGQTLELIAKGALLSALVLLIASYLPQTGLPRTVPIIHAGLAFLGLSALRVGMRRLFRGPSLSEIRPVMIFGAGEAGMELVNTLHHSRVYLPVALLDDDPKLHRLNIGGLRVTSPKDLARLTQETGAKVLLLAIPRLTYSRRREIVALAEQLGLEVKTIPSLAEIISGKASITELRTVTVEDLLAREPIDPDDALLQRDIAGKVVMVSGAGGSIGSELCRQILKKNPTTLVLFEQSEFALYTIEAELSENLKRDSLSARIVPILGSVLDRRRIEGVIKAFGIQTIYHAAAYKHVPLVEENVVAGIRNNVFGTQCLATAAQDLGVESFILTSTDKAVRPTNVMGATKRIAELICQALAQEGSKTTFSMVRFGNVLGSSGSVIPRFRAQIEAGGPVTVTHQDINRYFMTIPEASQLVIQAGAMARGGDVFVLDMGEPVRIMDLAISMIKLHGLTPYVVENPEDDNPDRGDIAICISGLRKGEKLYEELLIGNNPAPTRHPRIMTASEVSLPLADLNRQLDRLLNACETFDLPAILALLRDLPLEFQPRSHEVADLVWTENRTADQPGLTVIGGTAQRL